MFHLPKIILLVFLFIYTSAVFTAQAQIKKDGRERWRELIAPDTSTALKNTADHYLVCVGSAAAWKQFQQNNLITVSRQLSDSVFIISINPKLTAPDFNQQLKWIVKANENWKLSPGLLLQKTNNSISFPAKFFVSAYQAEIFLRNNKTKNIATNNTTSNSTFIVTINNNAALNELLQDGNVFFIATYNSLPTEELQINTLDLSVNKINLLHSKIPLLNGEGVTLSIKENSPDTTDIDFAARHVYNPLAAAAVTAHASIMATMAAGAGNSWYLGKGVAGAASLTASNFSNLLPDAAANYQQFHISVQNHSYGVGIENFYGADAAAYDASAVNNDSLLFVFSAGNSGNLTPATGNYSGIAGNANLTGSFKMAKNIITVGAVDSFGMVAGASSRGPAFDGRVKPELVAYGEDGTSGAAALVSGTAAVLQQAYKINHGGHLPAAALVKAIIINSADDVAAAGIDYTSGYGNLNTLKATENLLQSQYVEGAVSNAASQTFSISIPPNTSKAKFTLVWNDTPAVANAFRALINDVDMELKLPAAAQTWKPWVLNSFANKDSLTALPIRKRDSLNTVEQITLDNPAAGDYTIAVNGFSISSSTQPFYVAWQLDTTNLFSWNFPSAADNIFPAAYNIIRWSSDVNTANARLLYSIDNGSNWQLIENAVSSNKKYYYWNAPDTNALAMLKMQLDTQEFISDRFTISSKLNFKTGFNCADSVLWYWNHLPGISQYQLYSLRGSQLQPIATATDTQFVFNKNNFPYYEFAVAPVINGMAGVKSYTANFTKQGVDCYIGNVTADLVNDNTASIQLTLGTTYLIKKIVFEKLQQGNFVSLMDINSIAGLSYPATDANLQKGINTYRVRVELQNGNVLYSYLTSVFYFNNTDIVVFPNPVMQGAALTIQFKDLLNQEIRILDATGRNIFYQIAGSTSVTLPCNFSKGVYFVQIFNPENNQTKNFPLIVR